MMLIDIIDVIFSGEDPQIIELLQSAVQPAVLAMAFRDQKSMQKSGIGKSSYYLVGPVEIDRLKVLRHFYLHHQSPLSLSIFNVCRP